MKTQTKILLVLAALLLLGATASASRAMSASYNPAAPAGKMAGGRYVLVNQALPVNEALTGGGSVPADQALPLTEGLSGGRYRLVEPGQTTAATGCCCKGFMSCIRK